jgi:hypothetical protein
MILPAGGPRDPLAASAIALGTQLVVGMTAFSLLGWYIDRRRGGGLACTLAGIFLGLFYCGYEVWKVIRRIQEQEAADKDRRGGPGDVR